MKIEDLERVAKVLLDNIEFMRSTEGLCALAARVESDGFISRFDRIEFLEYLQEYAALEDIDISCEFIWDAGDKRARIIWLKSVLELEY